MADDSKPAKAAQKAVDVLKTVVTHYQGKLAEAEKAGDAVAYGALHSAVLDLESALRKLG